MVHIKISVYLVPTALNNSKREVMDQFNYSQKRYDRLVHKKKQKQSYAAIFCCVTNIQKSDLYNISLFSLRVLAYMKHPFLIWLWINIIWWLISPNNVDNCETLLCHLRTETSLTISLNNYRTKTDKTSLFWFQRKHFSLFRRMKANINILSKQRALYQNKSVSLL